VGAQEVGWEGDVHEPAEEYTFFYGKIIGNYDLGTGVSVH
jgi:hypothetical protein